MNRNICTLGAVLLTLAISSIALAMDDRGEDREQRGRKPPGVAIDACLEAAEAGACSFEGRRGEQLSGTCELIQEQLACVPEGHRRDRRADRRAEGRS